MQAILLIDHLLNHCDKLIKLLQTIDTTINANFILQNYIDTNLVENFARIYRVDIWFSYQISLLTKIKLHTSLFFDNSFGFELNLFF